MRRFRAFKPYLLMEPAGTDDPVVRLFDEPQFHTRDGHSGVMLDCFRRLRDERRLVFVCVHPNERFHREIVEEICESFLFVNKGSVTPLPGFASMLALDPARACLGDLQTGRAA